MKTPLKERYHRWTVLDPLDCPWDAILCQCDCGTLGRVDRYKLIRDRSKSCGCYRRDVTRGKTSPDLAPHNDWHVTIGSRHGRWTVLTDPEPNGHRHTVQCRCDCDTEKTVAVDDLRSGRSKSCGCLRVDTARAQHA